MGYRPGVQVRFNKLPDTLYEVRVPRISLMSEEEIELFGLPITVVNDKLHIKEQDFICCMISLERIIEIYRGGYPIYLRNPNDMIKIYEDMEKYLKNHNPEVVDDPNRPIVLNKPHHEVDNNLLYDINRFLNEIFKANKKFLLQEQLDALAAFDLGFQGMNIGMTAMKTDLPTRSSPVGMMSNYTDPNANMLGQNDRFSRTDNYNVGHMYNYSTMPQIDLDKIERQEVKVKRNPYSND